MARRADDRPGRRAATSLREREGGCWLVVSRSRQSDRGLGAVACSRQPEMHEDPMNDSGVVDGGDQLHPAGSLEAGS
jgi:hypothetical protein